jgi:RNA polymerase sigma-70 factor (ECF subfamily)
MTPEDAILEPETWMGGARRSFPTTHWSAILELRDPSHPHYARHLENLVQAYWKPVYHAIRIGWHRGVDDAKDLTQEFLARLLEKEYWPTLSPDRGSFRGYLKTALRHFMSDSMDADRVRRPRQGARVLSFEQAEEEWTRFQPPSGEATPEAVFDRSWVQEVMREAIQSLEGVLTRKKKLPVYEAFRLYYLNAWGWMSDLGAFRETTAEARKMSYEEIATRLGVKETDVRNYLTSARAKLKDILLERIRRYAASEAEAASELRILFS